MTSNLDSVNQVIAENQGVLSVLARRDLSSLLEEFDYDWISNSFNQSSEFANTIKSLNYEDEAQPGSLNRSGKLFMGRLLLHFDIIEKDPSNSITDKYSEFELISSGKNAIVFSARHKLLNSRVVLKIVRPGASENITDSIRRLSDIRSDSGLVLPIDYIEAAVPDLLGKPSPVGCIVFPYIKGKTFGEFLKQQNHHLNSQVVISFARQIARALAELERVGAYHGDLHEDNILVDQYADGGLTFRVVDVSFDAMGSLSREICKNNDLNSFKQHVWRVLAAQRAFVPTLSIRKYIGTRSYLIISSILSERADSFSNICSLLESDGGYSAFINDRDRFISKKFETPSSFRLQRYEEITDPTVAVELFVPFEELISKITEFGNMYVSGNRGSGKSTYLAALAFFPETAGSVVETEKIFGIYFPCRQGEFKALEGRTLNRESVTRATNRLLAIKIIRTTLEAVSAGLGAGKLSTPSDLSKLRDYVSGFVPPPGLVSVSPDVQSEMENLVSTMVRVEMVESAWLFDGTNDRAPPLELRSLIDFFKRLREAIPQLVSTQFHLLFDDAGTPYVPKNVQAALSDLMLLSNPIFCVKISAEKLTFDFCSSENKILEIGQDYVEHDISQVLFIGADKSLRREELSRYFRKIVQERLKHFRYSSTDILEYLGDHQIPPDELIMRLAKRQRNAYYCGWTAVWNIADRTPRNLLEIVSEVFAAGGIEPNSPPKLVGPSAQNRAIRTISEKRLDSLSQISGAIAVGGEEISLGRRLFEVTTAIGSTFRKYLRSDEGIRPPRQHLAVERNDLGELYPDAQRILNRLITFGVLDATKFEFSRDDEARKPIYVLNRIYCPIFGISYRRDDHLRLSKSKLEMLLMRPNLFLRDGTRRLRELEEGGEEDLFTYRQKL
ncbi:serine/threonine-protein kinase [Caulobacter segnis]|uniref:serine/threonine-protein kinase n=1 Tax=Caulobacter segnis TaxID=88688 RepID=UPI002855E5B6|nr:serine/threonine-protein kinase [Caulobacter segnis]MDR6626202.1 serine/threonine protein kinase [Caulobacter segnis]